MITELLDLLVTHISPALSTASKLHCRAIAKKPLNVVFMHSPKDADTGRISPEVFYYNCRFGIYNQLLAWASSPWAVTVDVLLTVAVISAQSTPRDAE